MGITISGEDFIYPIADIENRDIECATTKVEDGDFFVFIRINAIS